MEIHCPHRSLSGDLPVCRVAEEFSGLPLAECRVNDSACACCLTCGIAPRTPNKVTASMAIGAVARRGDARQATQIIARLRSHLQQTDSAVTTCVLRGPQVRRVLCKPCQAGGATPVLVQVFRCPRHTECTLNNTGMHPRIHACATCAERLEQYYELGARENPPEVLAAIRSNQGSAAT